MGDVIPNTRFNPRTARQREALRRRFARRRPVRTTGRKADVVALPAPRERRR